MLTYFNWSNVLKSFFFQTRIREIFMNAMNLFFETNCGVQKKKLIREELVLLKSIVSN